MVVKGIVCQKNMAHRGMCSRMKKPRLLILGGALQYQRESKLLSSFDTPSWREEVDYLKMVVAKIQVHNPDIILVEKSVTRDAQEYLFYKGISLVLNIKRPLLERIARCTGGQIVSSIDHLSSSQKLGYCNIFHVEKFPEEHGTAGQSGEKFMKTLMFFEGCPWPLGCTILLKGASGDELKKVKHVTQSGIIAAYHMVLETSFLADEGASLEELTLCYRTSGALPGKPSSVDRSIPVTMGGKESSWSSNSVENYNIDQYVVGDHLVANELGGPKLLQQDSKIQLSEEPEPLKLKIHPPPNSDHQGISVSVSSLCVWKGTFCEEPHLFRIEYYGNFDKPIGRLVRDNLCDQTFRCNSCDMPSEAHVRSYTHGQGALAIMVKKLPEFILPGEREGKIWMWHRCMRCPWTNGFPPATRRIVMSDASSGLSFGNFLNLTFSNHVAASCGHSLHRDCLRFYGYGRMVACFRYESIDVHSDHLSAFKPQNEFKNQKWTQKVFGVAEVLCSCVATLFRWKDGMKTS